MKTSVAGLLLVLLLGAVIAVVTVVTSNRLIDGIQESQRITFQHSELSPQSNAFAVAPDTDTATARAGSESSLQLQSQLFSQSQLLPQAGNETANQHQKHHHGDGDIDGDVASSEYFTTINDWPFPPPPATTKNQTHWCIIGRHSASKPARRFFSHFPHAAENLLPCWSWWRHWHVEDRCGIILLDGLYLPKDSWQHQMFVTLLECELKQIRREQPDRNNPLRDASQIYHTPSLYWKNPRVGRINYIYRPQDAWALRRLLISDSDVARLRQPQGNSSILHVGIIQRTRSRVITNLNDIVDLLRRDLPPTASITVLSDSAILSLREQATWFATKDVIIAAHGAALMNCLFILPQTIVMQLYPPNYFFQSLEPLIEAVGGIALDYYQGSDPYRDWRRAVATGKNNHVRDADIYVKQPSEVVDPILFTMGRKTTPSGWVNSLNVTGTNWTKNLLWMA